MLIIVRHKRVNYQAEHTFGQCIAKCKHSHDILRDVIKK